MELSSSQILKSYGTINAFDNAQLQLGDTYVVAVDTARAEYQRFVDSLFFPEIHTRDESIEQPSDGTFDWMFDNDDSTHEPSDLDPVHSITSIARPARCTEFVRWLKQDIDNVSSTFWVKGKAGSGKSTLMSHICHKISQWPSDYGPESSRPTILLRHFFWELGAPLQRSVTGCLRTLLWHFFISYADRGFHVWQDHLQHRLRRSGAWTSKTLNDTYDFVLTHCAAKFVIFIDGLDECTDRAQLLQFLRKQQKSQVLKLCVSSRPDRNLELAMDNWPSIKLEDLTKGDMYRYVESEVSAALSQAHASKLDQPRLDLTAMLVNKAQGVFAWLTIACKSLVEGIENRDDAHILLSRLEELPCDILQLYNHMLQRNHSNLKRYAETAACIFTLLLQGDPRSSSPTTFPLAWLTWALDDSARTALLQSDFEYDSVLSIHEHIDHDKTDAWVKSHCANLVDVVLVADDVSRHLRPLLMQKALHPSIHRRSTYVGVQVQFIHKTVADFLLNTIEGQSLLKIVSMTKKEVLQKIFQAALCDQVCAHVLASKGLSLWWLPIPGQYLLLSSLQYHEIDLVGKALMRSIASVDVGLWLYDRLWDFSFESDTENVIPACQDGFLYICNCLCYYEHVQRAVLDSGSLDSNVLTHLLFLTVKECGCSPLGGLLHFLFIDKDPRSSEFQRKAEHIRFLLTNGANPNLHLSFGGNMSYGYIHRLSPMMYCFYLLSEPFADSEVTHNLIHIIELLVDHGADLKITLPLMLLEAFSPRVDSRVLTTSDFIVVFQDHPLRLLTHETMNCEAFKCTCPGSQLLDTLSPHLSSLKQRKIAVYYRWSDSWHLLPGAGIAHGSRLAEWLGAHVAQNDSTQYSWSECHGILLGQEIIDFDLGKHEQRVTFSEFLRYFEWEEEDIHDALIEPNLAGWRALFTKSEPDH